MFTIIGVLSGIILVLGGVIWRLFNSLSETKSDYLTTKKELQTTNETLQQKINDAKTYFEKESAVLKTHITTLASALGNYSAADADTLDRLRNGEF